MARGAHLGILPPQRGRIESRAMRIEAATPQGRVTGETVSLGMTCDAALEILSCRLTMAQQKGTPRIVITCVQLSSSAQPGIHVAVSTKLSVVVAVTAVRLP